MSSLSRRKLITAGLRWGGSPDPRATPLVAPPPVFFDTANVNKDHP
jgi:hypothetical protein